MHTVGIGLQDSAIDTSCVFSFIAFLVSGNLNLDYKIMSHHIYDFTYEDVDCILASIIFLSASATAKLAIQYLQRLCSAGSIISTETAVSMLLHDLLITDIANACLKFEA